CQHDSFAFIRQHVPAFISNHPTLPVSNINAARCSSCENTSAGNSRSAAATNAWANSIDRLLTARLSAFWSAFN
ncbi:hypothetical protein, partial [Thiolapillus sp.]|uniref:hypothetical protein n=1 Tax=Thiolapillus sp. TaxID=2017437 RepID=UPI0025D72207